MEDHRQSDSARDDVAENLHGFSPDWIPRAMRRPFSSLPSRIIISVFATALVTSLVVAWISTRSIESFLLVKIDEKFPTILRSADERLELWYAQRELDVKAFAGSDIVQGSVQRMRGRAATARAARAELSDYLSYVLGRFSQYEALFVLDPSGRSLLQVGARVELPEDYRRQLAGVRGSRISELRELDGRRVQVASAAIGVGSRAPIASLHALVRIDVLESVLRSDDLGESGGVYVVSHVGEVMLRSPGAPPRETYSRALPAPGVSPGVEEYHHDDGSRVVGGAIHFERFAWTIVVEEAYDEAFSPVLAVIREILAINLGIVLVFGLIAYQIARSIVRPILALSNAARRIAAGETDVEIRGPVPGDEIGVLMNAFNDMSSRLRENQQELERNRVEIEDANTRLVEQNQELQRVSEVFQQLSITDDLTKLHNHRFFQDHLPQEIKRAKRTGEPLCLVLVDIDDFKKLNDRFGHAVGDAVLRKVAEVMNASIRDMDLLARYGGEEFALLAAHTTLPGGAALAEKMRLAISQACFSVVDLEGPKQIRITASFGVALFRGDEKAFFAEADGALYEAKARGKDCVVCADSEPDPGESGEEDGQEAGPG